MEKGKIVPLQWRNLANTTLTSKVFFLKIITLSNHEKDFNKPKLREGLQNASPVLLRTAKAIKQNKGTLEKRSQPGGH